MRLPAPISRFCASLTLLTILFVLPACGSGSSQTSEMVTIGLVTNNANGLGNVNGFVNEMAELGYVVGANTTYFFAGSPQTGADLERELSDIVSAQVDLIFTAGTPTGVAAHRITAGTGIPVVFGVIADPLAAGVMTDLTRPGGNMTGVKLGQHQDRRLELLLEIAPGTRRVLVPYNPADAAASSAVAQINGIAAGLGVELVLIEAPTDAAVAALLEDVPNGIEAIFLVPDSTVNAHLAGFVALATERGLPISGPSTAQVEDGALITYGFIHERAGAQAARMADRVLRGTDPGDLPVEDTESFLAVNLVTAEAIGLEVSDELLRLAEIIIRDPTEASG